MPKKQFIENLFDNIAPGYDKLNHILSLNIDKIWRKKAIKKLNVHQPKTILDIACGTADLSIELAKNGAKVIGVDLSEKMLEVGRTKVAKSKYANQIQLIKGDCANLEYNNDEFDAIGVSFGVRNFENLAECITEMQRVLKPNGHLMILELSTPNNKFISFFYNFYFRNILPLIGGLLTGNKKAYKYLNSSVENFPKPDKLVPLIKSCGFTEVQHYSYNFGLCRMYLSKK